MGYIKDNEDILLKRKYRELARKLSQINRELNTINNMNNDIMNVANTTLRINKKIVEDDSLKNLKNNNQRVINNVSSTISACNQM